MKAASFRWPAGWVCLAALFAASCGGGDGGSNLGSSGGGSGGGGTPPPATQNVVPVVVDSGPDSTAAGTFNTLYTSVTVCVPGSTTQCQTIDHIQVDTASYGLRILAPVLTLNLPLEGAMDGTNNTLVECTTFATSYSWGPVALADLQIGGEAVSGLPVQVIGASRFPTVPADCSGTGTAQDTVASFGANGILGIGPFQQDCGGGCAAAALTPYYYSCSATACAAVIAPLTAQVQNPVWLFAADNNGTIIDLPAVAAPGAASVSGSLIFGIDTQSNNASGNETVIALQTGADPSPGDFTTVFNAQTFSQSFIDSGTNGIYFDVSNDSSLPPCPGTGSITDFYCPATTVTLMATLTGANSAASAPVTFSIDNAITLFNDSFAVLPTIAGTFSSTTMNTTPSAVFDWGLPFFYGRRVATAIEGLKTAVGTGPYVAF